MRLALGIVDALQLAVAQSSFCDRDDESVAVGHPDGASDASSVAIEQCVHVAVSDVDGIQEPTGVVAYAQSRSHEGAAIRGPGRAKDESRIGGKRGDQFLSAAIRLSDPDFNHTAVGNTALEDQLLAVGREVNGGIDIANQLARGTSRRHLVEIAEVFGGLIRADEINVVAVGRKTYTRDFDDVGSEDLNIAFRCDVAHPEALLFSVPHGVDDVVSVGGDPTWLALPFSVSLVICMFCRLKAGRRLRSLYPPNAAPRDDGGNSGD